MKRVWQFLKDHSRAFAEWGTFFAVIVACYGIYVAQAQLVVMNKQIEQTNDHRRWQNYNDMNLRYAVLYESIPEEIISGKRVNFVLLPPEAQRWVRQYFDLYSEEYWLYKNNFIPEEMWTKRIHNGVLINLKTYPAIIDGYRYWKDKGAFAHPDDFRSIVEQAISDAEAEQIGEKHNHNK